MSHIHVVVFWIDEHSNPDCRSFSSLLDPDPMGLALKFMESKRHAGMPHVCMSVENSDSVGKPGVDTVADGKTPDGHAYEWSKQHRGSQRK